MPRFHHGGFDHRLDSQIMQKRDLRFTDQETAEDFATTQYMTDFIPRSVVKGLSGSLIVVENPEHIEHPHEIFHINSTLCEG